MNIQKIATTIAITVGLGFMSLTPAQADESESRYSNYDNQRHQVQNNRRENRALRHQIRDNRRENKVVRHQAREQRRIARRTPRHTVAVANFRQPHQRLGYNRYTNRKHQSNLQIKFSFGSRSHNNRYIY